MKRHRSHDPVAVRPQPEPARRARARDLRHHHARRSRRHRAPRPPPSTATRSSTCSRTTRAISSTPSTAPAAVVTRVVINAGAFTHYSFALADALATFDGREGRAAHLQPRGARALAPRLRDLALHDRAPWPASVPRATASRSKVRSHSSPRDRSPDDGRRTGRAAGDGRRWSGRAARDLRSPTPASTRCSSPSLPNVRYLTGFTGSSAMLLVTDDALVFTSDGRYRTQAGEQLAAARVDAQIEIGATVAQQREALAAALTPGARVGLEAHAVTWAQQRDFAVVLDGHELVPTDGLVEHLRRVKEPAEVARIHAACSIADDALGALAPAPRRPPHRARLRARPRGRDAPAGRQRQQLRPDRRVGSQRREAARPPERAGRWRRASSSSSTSAASSTATAPT